MELGIRYSIVDIHKPRQAKLQAFPFISARMYGGCSGEFVIYMVYT